MKIINIEKVLTRNNTLRFYFTILNEKKEERNCSIEIYRKEPLKINCTCTYGTIKGSDYTGIPKEKYCRHCNFCLSHLKETGLIK